ncbi:Panacea domain-containing protein [Parabacteroides sp. AM08-6]|uniref:Panacea domain-containing protein n=1 Tax=Parabacteroides sp. AM08-6 TaxID=2292053 RepID=UPI000F00D3FD|nr:Panacea domain-containing protein [Parabacteroides sp. AM08-6]RHJ82339.1 DUF4065 domain-containing protein [Parabacteroides sp. AM08-6]
MGTKSTFKKDVAIQAILYAAQHVERKDIHKICKILYFADQDHLSKYGRSITGDTYIAMPFGPVPSNVEDIFKAVRGDSFFSDCVDDLKEYFDFINKYVLITKKKADTDYLSESDLECLDKAIEKCKDKSFNELTEMSHDLAWSNTQRDRAISIKDILREVGDDEEYVSYIDRKIATEDMFI